MQGTEAIYCSQGIYATNPEKEEIENRNCRLQYANVIGCEPRSDFICYGGILMKSDYYSFGNSFQGIDSDQLEKLRVFNVQMYERIAEVTNINKQIQWSKQIENISKVFASREMELMRQNTNGFYTSIAYWNNTIASQAEKYLQIIKSNETTMMKSIRQSLLNLNFAEYRTTIEKTMSALKIEVADIAYLKKIESDNPALDAIWPKGFKTLLKDLNVSSANRLASCADISLNSQTKEFQSNHNPDSTADASEMNVICAGASVFEELGADDISEASLIDLMTFLERTPTLALTHHAAQKINAMITNWFSQTDFDREYYYHARARNEDAAPYTYQMMLRAPAGVTGPGRYNHPGRAHYYFSNTAEGAKAEVKRHISSDSAIQVVQLVPNAAVRMLDLSGSGVPGNAFLKYVRFAVDDDYKTMPREYYIPCFVADCCIRHNLDGIKYYGGKEYTNYVVWECRFFEYVAMV